MENKELRCVFCQDIIENNTHHDLPVAVGFGDFAHVECYEHELEECR